MHNWRKTDFIAALLIVALLFSAVYAQNTEITTGYVTTTPQIKKIDVYNDGKHIYAICNGVVISSGIYNTDDQKVISDAITAFGTNPGVLHIASGTYLIEDLTITANDLLIYGDSGTTIKLKDSTSKNEDVFILSNCNNLKIMTLKIDGNGANLSNIGNFEYKQCGIIVQNSTNILLSRLDINAVRQNAIYFLHASDHSIVESCTIRNSNTGILTFNGSFGGIGDSPKNIIVSNNTITNINLYESKPKSGVYFSQGMNLLAVNNTISDCDIGVRIGAIRSATITKNTIINTVIYGISKDSAVSNGTLLINQNVITGSNQSGIYLGGPVMATITNNTILSNSMNGIVLFWPGATIKGNTISHNGMTGIVLHMNATNSTIRGNIIQNNSQTNAGLYNAIFLASSDSTVTGNIANDTQMGKTQRYGVCLAGNNNVVQYNILMANRNGPYLNAGSGNIISNNK